MCGVNRRVRGAVLSRRAEGRSCEKAHVKVPEEVEAQCCAVVWSRELTTEGVESGSFWTESRRAEGVWFSASSLRSAREDVPAELALHERHERREARGTHVAREAHVAQVARGRRAVVNELQGSRDSFPISFSLGLCKCLWEGACRG